MVVYVITKMYIRNDDNGVNTQVFTDKEEAMQAFSKTIADLQSEYEYEIKEDIYTEDTDKRKNLIEYTLFDFDNPNDFIEQVVLTTHNV